MGARRLDARTTRTALTPSSGAKSTSNRTLQRATTASRWNSRRNPSNSACHSGMLQVTGNHTLPHNWPGDLPPAGWIRSCIGNWEQISDDPWILEVVMGYHLELAHMPQQWSSPQERSLKESEQDMVSEVAKLLLKQAIKLAKEVPNQFLSVLFLVLKKDGSQPPVINLKPLNRFLSRQKFKMEGAKVIRDILQKDDWMVSIDLKDAYLSVPVAKEDRRFLRFRWKGTLYEFQCLPFGLSSAPRVFTKLLKSVVALFRRQGIRCIIFLDDLLIMQHTQKPLRKTSQDVLTLLQVLGFWINWEKSALTPTQVIQYLGLQVDSTQMIVALPTDKLRGIIQSCSQASRRGSISIRDLARLIGRMTATAMAVLPAPLCYRNLQRLKNQGLLTNSGDYDAKVLLDQAAKEELQWWTHELLQWNGKPLQPPSSDLTIETDASLLGWGAVANEVSTGSLWSEEERQSHINHLEMLGAVLAVQTYTKDKTVSHVHLRMDNQTAVCYINHMGGTRSTTLSHTACRLWEWCLERGVTLSAEYLPGSCNVVADRESLTLQSSAEWKLDRTVFLAVLNQYGPCSVDLFASRLNFQLPHYISWRPDPQAMTNGCVFSGLERPPGVCLPSICPNRQMPTEDTTGGVNSGINSPSVAIPVMVSMATGNVGLGTSTSASPQESSARPVQQGAPPATQGATATSRLESVQHACSLSGISERATNIISAGWRWGTNSAYQSGWIKWTGWCSTRGLNPLSCSVQHFLDFLTELFDSGLQHRTINVVRSAVSMIHEEVERIPIGQHPLVTRLMKGVYNLRPPKPRYTYTWDVDMVIQYIAGLGENTNLPAKKLSQKLVLLMALVVASRTSELQALDLRFRVYRPNGVLFRLANITKTQKAGSPPKERFFGAFPDKRFCVVECLKYYEEMTLKHRDMQAEVQPLFLSYIKPFKPVTSQRIAHWIKDILSEAGVDTRVFKAHSVRGASVSAAKNKGVRIPDILDMADWSRDTTFRRFYYRTTTSNVYTQSVLCVSDGK